MYFEFHSYCTVDRTTTSLQICPMASSEPTHNTHTTHKQLSHTQTRAHICITLLSVGHESTYRPMCMYVLGMYYGSHINSCTLKSSPHTPSAHKPQYVHCIHTYMHMRIDVLQVHTGTQWCTCLYHAHKNTCMYVHTYVRIYVYVGTHIACPLPKQLVPQTTG